MAVGRNCIILVNRVFNINLLTAKAGLQDLLHLRASQAVLVRLRLRADCRLKLIDGLRVLLEDLGLALRE